MASIDYFRILDLDKDGFVGFFDFLQPLMSVIPQDVIAMFSQDQRFQQETFNELRIAFSQAARNADGKMQKSVTVSKMNQAILDKPEHMRVTMRRAFDQLLILLKLKDATEISNIQFELGMARLEKRTLFTFVSSLYQSQERRLVIQEQQTEAKYIPDQILKTTAKAALDDPNLTVEQAKALIQQLNGKVDELETRLQDFEDCSQKLSPEQLPQSQATGEDIWTRFRRCMPSFIDVVIDSAAQMQDINFLVMSQNVQRKMIADLQQENRDNRKYEARYQKIVADLSKADDVEEKQMSQGAIKVINKHLLKE